MAFSFNGLSFLTTQASAFTDQEFRAGLAASSTRIGDPSDPASDGNVRKWKVGGTTGLVPDVFIIAAADRNDELVLEVANIDALAHHAGCAKVYQETGHDLSYYSTPAQRFPSGHEHFGFKDGISQPGIRGVLPDGEPLTTRSIKPDPADTGVEYADFGQPLVCVGQFLLGYAKQIDVAPRMPGPPASLGPRPYAPDAGAVAPWWAQNGSFLVFRRLRQDVAAFRTFKSLVTAAINRPDVAAQLIEAFLVGRWPSGASLMRANHRDDLSQATRQLANAFGYDDYNISLNLPVDADGVVCPVTAHLRKVNPRDEDTDQGAASATLLHRILRRGIPYGPPYDLPGLQTKDRGLLFLSYQSSIKDQFEFLAFQWMNQPGAPRNPSGHVEGLGYDLLVGQNQAMRDRFAYFRFAYDGGGPPDDIQVSNTTMAVKDWVVPTGGGYFFAPSITTMKTVLAE